MASTNSNIVGDGQAVRVSVETLFYIPGKLVVAVAAVIAVPIYTRLFSAEELGRLDVALKVALFVWTLCVLWLNNVLLRFYPAYAPRNQAKSFLTAVTLMKWSGVGAGLLLYLGLWAAGPERFVGSWRDLLAASLLAFVGRSCLDVSLAFVAAKRKPVGYSTVAALNAVGKLGIGVLLAAWCGLGVAGVLWAAGIVPLAINVLGLRRYFGRLRIQFTPVERAISRQALTYGGPVCLLLVLNFFLSNGDRFVLKVLGGDAELGLYSIGHFLADQPVQLVYATLMLAAFPAVMHRYESSGQAATENLISSLIRLYLLVAVPTCVFLSVLAHPIWFVLAHGAPRASYVVAPWVASAAFLVGLSHYYTLGLYVAKRPLTLLWATGTATALNLAVNIVLVPGHGFMGCAVARLLSNAAMLGIVAAVSYRCLRARFPVAACCRIGVAAGTAGAALAASRLVLSENIGYLALQLCAGFALYGILLMVVGELSRDELRQFLRAAWRGCKGA